MGEFTHVRNVGLFPGSAPIVPARGPLGRLGLGRLALFLVLMVPPGSAALAQDAAIGGTVRDSSGGVLPGVTVEASSPALIEKVRTTVTNETGQYKILELRAGAYTVTFTLAGFNTIRREGLQLPPAFTATVNAELTVGALEETIVVTGASPIVDLDNVRTQATYDRDLLDALPYARNLASLAQMMPGVNSGRGIPGTGSGDGGGVFAAHGSDSGVKSVDGFPQFGTLRSGVSRIQVSDAYTDEVVLEVGGGNAEALGAGVRLNVITKDGGNTFSGSFFSAFSNADMISDNFNEYLRQRGARAGVQSLKRIYDVGGGVGGPIVRNRLWFYFAPRYWGNDNFVPGVYHNLTPHTLFYAPDLSRPFDSANVSQDTLGKVTWQVASRHKVTVSVLNTEQRFLPYSGTSGPRPRPTPEGASEFTFLTGNPDMVTGTWTYPATNRLLVEAGGYWRSENVSSVPNSRAAVRATDQPVVELSTNLGYGSHAAYVFESDYGVNPSDHNYWRGSVSYVASSHNLKVGGSYAHLGQTQSAMPISSEVYEFRNQRPVSLTQLANPNKSSVVQQMWVLFVEDQWKVNRFTLNGGVRLDSMLGSAPKQVRPGGVYVPDIPFDAVENIPNWKSVHPRLGAVYDLFGNGRTALKFSVGSFEASQNMSLIQPRLLAPANAMVVRAQRTWNDTDGNFIPNCDLHNKLANGECGPLSDQNFGTSTVTTQRSDYARTGWNVSPWFWQTSVSVQQELLANVGVMVGYFRTVQSNQEVLDNLAVVPEDFTRFCITSPVDSLLPGGGGYPVCAYDVSREKFGKANYLIRSADEVGGQINVFNGVDATIDARLRGGARVYGGVSLGHNTYDTCGTPDVPGGVPLPQGDASYIGAPPQFCAGGDQWLQNTEVKISAVYPLPWWGIQTSGMYRNQSGALQTARYVATNAELAPLLGRNLAACPSPTGSCTATKAIDLIQPGEELMEPRTHNFDFRLSKVFRLGGVRVQGNLDLYNAFNASDILALNPTWGPVFGTPTSLLPGRMIKVGVQLDLGSNP